jgi:hypothetical protein
VVVSTNPSDLEYTFETPGIYSIAVAAYNSSGLGAITRIDGIEVLPKGNSGLCETVNSVPLSIDDPHTPGTSQTLGFSGKCVSVVKAGGATVLYASTSPIDIDGVPLTPQPGDAIVIRPPYMTTKTQIYVTKCTITTFSISLSELPSLCPDPTTTRPTSTSAGSVLLALSGGAGQSGSGIAEETNFNATKADMVLGPLPAKNPSLVDGCGLSPGAQLWPRVAGSLYDGFDVVSNPCVTFLSTKQSTIDFSDDLPPGFGNTSGAKATSAVHLAGMDVPPTTAFSTNHYPNVAAEKGRRVIDGTGSTLAAHAADDAFPSVPPCPPDSDSSLSIPPDTDIGPITLGSGDFCYDSALGAFIGDVMVDIPGPLELKVGVGFEIGHGRLIQASGELGSAAGVPVGPAVLINDLKFDIQTEPTVVAGEIEASIADALSVEAAAVITPSIPDVTITGTVTIPIDGLQLGNFELEFHRNTVGMHVTVSESFGPVDVNLTVKGAMQLSPSFAFYLEGEGSACLLICLDAKGVISNIGLAACGSINLVFTTVSVGAGVLWKGPNAGVHVFTGCDLDPYIPLSLQNVPGTVTVRLAPNGRVGPDGRAATATVLEPGATMALKLNPGKLCLPRGRPHPIGCTQGTVAVQVHSLVSEAGVGNTPLVTLAGPMGDPRVISTPATPDQLGVLSSVSSSSLAAAPGAPQANASGLTDEGSALVVQEPVPVYDLVTDSSADCPTTKTTTVTTVPGSCPKVSTTTIFVADPGTGKWTLSVAPGSPPVVDVSIAAPEPPVSPGEFNAGVRPVTLTAAPSSGAQASNVRPGSPYSIPESADQLNTMLTQHTLVFAPSVEITPANARERTALAHPTAADLDVPAIDRPLLRAILLKIPSGWKGTVSVVDHGPTTDDVIDSDISTSMIPSGGLPILFEPSGDFGAEHQIEAFLTPGSGLPSQMLMVSSYAAPSLPTPVAPTIERIVRSGASVDVYFDPGDAPIVNGVDVAVEVGNSMKGGAGGSLTASNVGERIEETVPDDPHQLHAIGATSGFGAAVQASEYMVSIPNIDPTEPISVSIDDSAGGQMSPTAQQFVASVSSIASISESQLLASSRPAG